MKLEKMLPQEKMKVLAAKNIGYDIGGIKQLKDKFENSWWRTVLLLKGIKKRIHLPGTFFYTFNQNLFYAMERQTRKL